MTRTEIPIPETITAWQCIGFGRLESPQNCIGVCQDRKVEVVSARDCAEVLSAFEDANERIAVLEAFLSRLARIAPREGRCEETYRCCKRRRVIFSPDPAAVDNASPASVQRAGTRAYSSRADPRACEPRLSKNNLPKEDFMQRRSFIASGLGWAASAIGGFAGMLAAQALRAQAAPAAPSAPQGKWIRLAALPQGTGELLAVAVNGRIYASQGLLPGFKPAGLVYEYDPGADAWSQRKPMPHPVHHAAVTAQGGKMYVFGGFDLPATGAPGWNPVADTWEYDPASDAWRARAPMPTARGGGIAAFVGGKCYVIGGAAAMPGASDPAIRPRQPQRSLGTVEEYDPASDSWRARAPMPTPCNHMGGEAVNGKIYAIGGRLSGAFIIGYPGNVNLVQAYDPATDSWSTKAPMPTARSGLNTASLNGVIYAAGGEVQDEKSLSAFKAFEAYHPASDTWWQLPSMLLPRHECIMAALGNRIHVAGGSVQSAIVPTPKGLAFETDAHEAFELAS